MLTVVTGPPCSGKTTYVRTRAGAGDIIIDFDAMAQSFGSPVPHEHNAAIRHVTMMARRAAIDAAIVCHERGATAWVVDCNIPASRMRAYTRTGAHIVTLGAELGELHKRAARERPGLWHKLIDEWQPPAGTPAYTRTSVATSREW